LLPNIAKFLARTTIHLSFWWILGSAAERFQVQEICIYKRVSTQIMKILYFVVW